MNAEQPGSFAVVAPGFFEAALHELLLRAPQPFLIACLPRQRLRCRRDDFVGKVLRNDPFASSIITPRSITFPNSRTFPGQASKQSGAAPRERCPRRAGPRRNLPKTISGDQGDVFRSRKGGRRTETTLSR